MKQLFTFLFLLLVSFNTYALHIENGELLDSTVTKTPGVEGGVIEMPDEAIVPSTEQPNSASVDAIAHSASGKVRTNIRLESYHRYRITNSTAQDQVYEFAYNLGTEDGQHINRVDHVRLSPHGSALDNATLYLLTYHDKPGNYRITAESKVSGESSDSHSDRNTLRVYS